MVGKNLMMDTEELWLMRLNIRNCRNPSVDMNRFDKTKIVSLSSMHNSPHTPYQAHLRKLKLEVKTIGSLGLVPTCYINSPFSGDCHHFLLRLFGLCGPLLGAMLQPAAVGLHRVVSVGLLSMQGRLLRKQWRPSRKYLKLVGKSCLWMAGGVANGFGI